MATLVLKDLIVCKHLLFKGLQELDMFSFFLVSLVDLISMRLSSFPEYLV